MSEGAEIANTPVIELSKNFLREASPSELSILSHAIGEKAIKFVQDKGIRIDCLYIGDINDKFALEVGDKAIEILIYEEQRQREVQIAFKLLRYLNEKQSRKSSDEESLKPYLETEKTKITKETLEFLRLAGNFVLEIDPDCMVDILPASQRRAQIFRKFLNLEEHPNIHIAQAFQNDIKTKAPV